MGRRRRSRPKNPRRGPGHNEVNRQSRDSKQRSMMLDGGQETRFRYYMEEILIEEGGMEPETARPFIQGLWTQGFRNSLEDATEWLRGKANEGLVADEQVGDILALMNKYKRMR